MSETTRVRLLLGRYYGDKEPTVAGAIDAVVWDFWEDEEQAAWLAHAQLVTTDTPDDFEWCEAWATFNIADLIAAFGSPVVTGTVSAASPRVEGEL